jgi:predicted secreted protein
MTGKDIIVVLSQNNVAVASTKVRSQDIKTSCGTIERASATQQQWEEHIAGRKRWTLSVSCLILTAPQIKDLLKAGQSFDITMQKVNDSTNKVSGTAILTEVSVSASIGSLAKGNFSFLGTGPLT